MLNHIDLLGRMTRDPELRRTGSGTAVASFTVAVDRDFAPKDGGERGTDFIDCVAWRSTGEFISKYFQKGSMIAVSGRLQIRSWTDKDGNKRRTAEVNVENAYFSGSKSSKPEATVDYQTGAGPYDDTLKYAQNLMGGAPASDYALLEDEDSFLPF